MRAIRRIDIVFERMAEFPEEINEGLALFFAYLLELLFDFLLDATLNCQKLPVLLQHLA